MHAREYSRQIQRTSHRRANLGFEEKLWLAADQLRGHMDASADELASHGYALTPGRYVGAADVEDDGEPFEEKLNRPRG